MSGLAYICERVAQITTLDIRLMSS